MIRRALDLTTGLSIAVCGLALYCWLASATGWKPEGWNLSPPEIQDHVPDRSVLGLTFIGGSKGLGEASVRILRYQPLSNPVDGPPEEYRDELFPFTTWTLRLTKFSDRYGFSSSKEPVSDPTRPRLDGAFDRNTTRPRLVGVYEEW